MPDPCFFSSLVRYFWPAGLARRKSTAASEKAHLRWALPIFVPEVQSRFPADAFELITGRPADRAAMTKDFDDLVAAEATRGPSAKDPPRDNTGEREG